MGQNAPLPQPLITLTVSYLPPENDSLEKKVIEISRKLAKSLIYPWHLEHNAISTQYIFKSESDLLKFKELVSSEASSRGIYIHFSS